jgi:hypothetical protein
VGGRGRIGHRGALVAGLALGLQAPVVARLLLAFGATVGGGAGVV